MTNYDPTSTGTLDVVQEPATEMQAPTEFGAAEIAEEPTGTGVASMLGTEAAAALPEAEATPTVAAPAKPAMLPPFPIALRHVSGSYVGIANSFELDLRVDVDGARPMRRMSGDFVRIIGSTRTYFGSFVIDSLVITNTKAGEVIRGLGRFTFSASHPVLEVTIPRRRFFQPAAPATVRFLTTTNQLGATYVCSWGSPFFRSVTLQTETVSDVPAPLFTSYDTGSLPSGGPARTLSVVTAYAEAGIEVIPAAAGPVIDIAEAAGNHMWSDAELMASMATHFTHYGTAPHWDLWQLQCLEHELGPSLLGIMFDSQGRQGCAVFNFSMGGTTPDQLRTQLYCHVHELGHCFNLMHSWQKSLAKPAGVDNPSALSWMNYPQKYAGGGTGAFWAAFPFQFIDNEIVHLRHAFRAAIIPEGNPFTIGAAEIDPQVMSDPVEDVSGLDFRIEPVHSSFLLGEPVVVELRLSSFDKRPRMVHGHLSPQTSGVSIAVARPDGRAVRFEPLVDHLVSRDPQPLQEGKELSETAYLGSGKHGLYFEQPGTYKVRGIYHAPDGSRVMSNVTRIRVRYPATQEDNDVAELMLGEQQGALFALRGSDAEHLRAGNDALDTVIEKYGKHPLATYARYQKAFNAARAFKLVDDAAPKRLRVRAPDIARAQSLMNAVSAPTTRLDEISKAQGFDRLAVTLEAAGNSEGASQVRQTSQKLRAASRR